MDIRQLRYFTAIVEEGTLTGAAKRLNMTQPPLTAQLKLLEEELRCPLFTREGKRLHLTEAGHHFYERALRILGMCDAAVTEMADFQEGAAGTLRIGVISSVKDQLFPQWIQSFWEKYPNIRYEIYSANTYQLLDQLQNGQLDLALVRTPFPKSELDILYIKKEPFLAVGIPSFFPDPEKESLTLRELENVPFIFYRRWEKMLKYALKLRVYLPGSSAVTTMLRQLWLWPTWEWELDFSQPLEYQNSFLLHLNRK